MRHKPKAYNAESVERMKGKLTKGEEIEPLFLDVDLTHKKVTSHEGRHRARAAELLKVKKVPVIIYYKRFGKFVDISQVKRLPKIRELSPQR